MKNSNNKQTAYKKEEPSSLEEFFIDELKDIYWAEKHLTKSIPEMKDAATSEDLKLAFNNHLTETYFRFELHALACN